MQTATKEPPAVTPRLSAAATSALLVLAGAPAAAQDRGVLNWTPGNFALTEGRFGLGVGYGPDYLGSDDYRAIPLPNFAFTLGTLEIQNNLLGVEINVRPGFPAPRTGRATVAYGPILRYDFGRNDIDTVDDPVVALTEPVDATPQVGGFIEATIPLGGGGEGRGGAPALLTSRLSVLYATSSYNGTVAQASVGVVRPMGSWTLGGGVAATVADGNYTGAYFGVSAADAAATGLPAYSAGGGLLDVGVSLFASYRISESWSVDGLAGYTVLLGDAADSPLVEDRGQAGQAFAGLGLTWRF
jgi:outer membrane scaffolding protein for murein synthesis (MipA/OmpV family)